MSQQCPVRGCPFTLGTTRYGVPLLMCAMHWAKVPKVLQDRVWDTYRAMRRSGQGEEYRAARADAIAAAEGGPHAELPL